ncbi:hypothetical protein [Arthrobacter oryzae]|uniref:Uncharacterized protein n=1 Tax=Arthrobacter oryzae TaxID=409290 RepID=A0A3N0BRY4_9MICC|nr:hypothetical protein [Arthrobacter oryzae]RNL51579.1 hypothetical protein D7003_15740 [Arthrobacter oryzae]
MNNTTTSPVAPEGFVQAMDPVQPDLQADYFDGPTEAGDGWKIETTFTVERGVQFEILPSNGDYSLGGLTASQALEAGRVLARMASKYA